MNQKKSYSSTYTMDDFTMNRMGYGAMRITGTGIWGLPKDREASIRFLKRTVELGINFVDTANRLRAFHF